MLCIKGFADPLCYLLSLLSPGPARLLGRIKLPERSKPLLQLRHLFLGTAWKPRALESLLAPPPVTHALTRTVQRTPAVLLEPTHNPLSAGGRDANRTRSSVLCWVSPLLLLGLSLLLMSHCPCLILPTHIHHPASCWPHLSLLRSQDSSFGPASWRFHLVF